MIRRRSTWSHEPAGSQCETGPSQHWGLFSLMLMDAPRCTCDRPPTTRFAGSSSPATAAISFAALAVALTISEGGPRIDSSGRDRAAATVDAPNGVAGGAGQERHGRKSADRGRGQQRGPDGGHSSDRDRDGRCSCDGGVRSRTARHHWPEHRAGDERRVPHAAAPPRPGHSCGRAAGAAPHPLIPQDRLREGGECPGLVPRALPRPGRVRPGSVQQHDADGVARRDAIAVGKEREPVRGRESPRARCSLARRCARPRSGRRRSATTTRSRCSFSSGRRGIAFAATASTSGRCELCVPRHLPQRRAGEQLEAHMRAHRVARKPEERDAAAALPNANGFAGLIATCHHSQHAEPVEHRLHDVVVARPTPHRS